jgi:pyrroloquinoline-quinone synthase
MTPWSHDELVEQLRAVGREHYHDRHPFHVRMNRGELSRDEVRAWAANRYYYQKSIPIKDAVLLSQCPLREVRRLWVHRILDHDGTTEVPGGIELWLRLGEAVGLSREDLESDRHLLAGARDAVDSYVDFVRTHSWIEGVASSLTELFAPGLLRQRLDALERHYPWIEHAGFDYFRGRIDRSQRDGEEALGIVLRHAVTRADQESAVDALRFKCGLLWAQLNALSPAEARP